MKSKRLIPLLLMIFGASSLVNAQESYPQITNVVNRQSISLDGVWRSITDPFENGYYDYRLEPLSSNYGKDRDITDKSVLQEYNFGADKTIIVPGDWNTQRDNLYYYEGTVWYRTRFDFTRSEDRVFLYFGAVNYQTLVFLNGQLLGEHIGGYTPFNFEVTDIIRDGENSLVLKVDNKRSADAVPTLNSDWWNYGGITRQVKLLETPATFIADHYLQLKKGENNIISGEVQLDGTNLQQEVSVEIPELGKTIKATTSKDGKATFSLKAKVELWSPENPKLYDVIIRSQEQTICDKIGFRTIETEGTKILLNGKEIFCRGISIHEEAAFRAGRVTSKEQCYTLLAWAKELGCNFVRLAHYPHNEEMVRLAEELGLMVWSEIPVYWTIDWDNPETYKNAENQLVDMITRDKNRCNVIIWSIANETPLSDDRYTFLKSLATKVREKDDVRLVGAAMEKEEIEPGVMTVDDPLEDLLDIISFNQYVGWYGSLPEKCDEVNWVFNSNKPVFISEFGGGALYGYHGEIDERFTEEYQEDLYIRSINMLKRIPALAGTTPWILKDFRSPRRQLPAIQDDYNRKGLISDEGQRKKAFFVLQEWYNELEESYK